MTDVRPIKLTVRGRWCILAGPCCQQQGTGHHKKQERSHISQTPWFGSLHPGLRARVIATFAKDEAAPGGLQGVRVWYAVPRYTPALNVIAARLIETEKTAQGEHSGPEALSQPLDLTDNASDPLPREAAEQKSWHMRVLSQLASLGASP